MPGATHNISLYPNATSETKSDKVIPLDFFLENIRSGEWQDAVLKVRCITDLDKQKEAKKQVPAVTIGGTFSRREDAGLLEHSGYIAIDIDNVGDDVEGLKRALSADRYVAAAFVSISGRGLCVLFRIHPPKHREAFQGISEYLYQTYNLICDPTSVNVSRLRFVSYDPYLYVNLEGAEKFTRYPTTKPPKRVDRVIYAQDDFEKILEQIVSRRLNLCDSYHDWVRIGFAFAHKFGEAGRSAFHTVSQYSAKYDSNVCDRQYTACVKAHGSKEATIATFYHYCKEAGLSTYSERTKRVASIAIAGKRAGLSPQQVGVNLKKFEDIEGADDLVKQVMDDNIELGEETLLEQLESWLRQGYDLRQNEISRMIEVGGTPMKLREYNSIFIRAKKIFDKLSFEMFERLLHSEFVPVYNPFLEWFEQHQHLDTDGHIQALFGSVKCRDADYLLHFGRKWLVGIISAIHGDHSPLLLVLSGEKQGTGKTEFFRRLLPPALKVYYAESKLDAGKDDEILMTQKLLIMDDELGGKSKKDNARLKELTSKQVFSLREPYGRNNVDLDRLAVLCGTSNDNELLHDPTGNRRIIPIHVFDIDHAAYNAVDKAALFMEAYRLWKSGWAWQFSKADIEYLGIDKLSFQATSPERDMILKFYEPTNDETHVLTSTEIAVEIEAQTRLKLSSVTLGRMLASLKFVGGRSGQLRGWRVKRKF